MNHIQSTFQATTYLLPGDFAGSTAGTSVKSIRRTWMIQIPGGNVFQNK